MRLGEMRPGMSGRVLRLDGDGALRVRLLEMGLTPGTRVQVCRAAPLGDPLALRLRGYSLSLRREDAMRVEMEAT